MISTARSALPVSDRTAGETACKPNPAPSCSTCPSMTSSMGESPFSSEPVTPADETCTHKAGILGGGRKARADDVGGALLVALHNEREAGAKTLLGRDGSLSRAARKAKEAAKNGLRILKKKDSTGSLSGSTKTAPLTKRKDALGNKPRLPPLRHSQLSPEKRVFSMPNLQIPGSPDNVTAKNQKQRRRKSAMVKREDVAKTRVQDLTETSIDEEGIIDVDADLGEMPSLPRTPQAVLRTVLFPIWCFLVGGSLLLCPHLLPTLVFGTGYVPAPRTALHRLAYYAHCALPHAVIFAAMVLGVAMWNAKVGVALAVTVLGRAWAVWSGYDGAAGMGAAGNGTEPAAEWQEDMKCVYMVLMGKENEVVTGTC